MNSFYGIVLIASALVLVAQSAPFSDSKCPSICTAIWAPVCAHNGKCHKTFGSSCNLASENCLNKDVEEFTFKHKGECNETQDNICSDESEDVKALDTQCNQMCTFIYKPVCAHNGSCYQTFPSTCVLESSNCVNRSQAKFNHISDGECNSKQFNICEQ
ncbi:hypothetical protein ACFFRR_010231 [Megaselia abdita]